MDINLVYAGLLVMFLASFFFKHWAISTATLLIGVYLTVSFTLDQWMAWSVMFVMLYSMLTSINQILNTYFRGV